MYRSTASITAATMLTQVLIYNNTRITTSSLVPNAQWNYTEAFKQWDYDYAITVVGGSTINLATVTNLVSLGRNGGPYSAISLGTQSNIVSGTVTA
jgi:hypothetical protein